MTTLMPRLKGGHLIVTARAANFPASLRKLELDALDEDAATNFLLERTADDRERAKDDEAQARTLAGELGGLALGLEQAGAQIATDRIGFARYLKLWNERRDDALAWSDPTLTGSEKTLATTWATSVARLSPESRRLLDRLAMLAPDPIPDSLLDVAVPGEAADFDARKARAGLFAYSLATRAKRRGSKGFVIHRLVQDFARRAMSEARRAEALSEALGWVNAAFTGDPTTCGLGRSLTRSRRTRSRSQGRRMRRGSPSRRRGCSINSPCCHGEGRYAEPSRFFRRDSRSTKLLAARTILSSQHASTILRACSMTRTASGGRAAHAPRAGDRRGEPRAGPSRCGDPPQQSRGLAPRARTASPRPSRSCAARSRSTRRASGLTIPTWRSASTISRNC